MIQTVKLKILPSSEQIAELRRMSEQYRQACNFVSEYTFENGIEMNSFKLQKELYAAVRSNFGLKAQMAVSVFRTVTARYKAVQEQLRQNPYHFRDPHTGEWHDIPKDLGWLRNPIRFRRPQVDLVLSRDYSFDFANHQISLNTLGKRIKVDYVDGCWQDCFDGSWTFGTGKVVELNGSWYFHIPCTKESPEELAREQIQHVVGIDRGLRFIISTFDECGKCGFASGKEILRKRQKFIDRRKELQSKHTWSAFKALKRLSGRENRWMSDVNHRISKTLVEKYGPNTLFVIEDLTGVSFEESNLNGTKKQNRDKRSWAFYQLEQFLTYKAEAAGSRVLKVSPKYTSQRCPKCGRIYKANRKHDKHIYVCDKCGYRSNDDRIAAMNIQFLGTLWVSGDEHPRFGIRKETTSAE